jgi:hypothetical protein
VLFLSQSLRRTPHSPSANLWHNSPIRPNRAPPPPCAATQPSCRCSSHVVHRVIQITALRPNPPKPQTPAIDFQWLASAPRTYFRLVEGPKALAVAIAGGGPRACFEERVASQLHPLRALYQPICHVLPPSCHGLQ